jgi:hypothetical protein
MPGRQDRWDHPAEDPRESTMDLPPVTDPAYPANRSGRHGPPNGQPWRHQAPVERAPEDPLEDLPPYGNPSHETPDDKTPDNRAADNGADGYKAPARAGTLENSPSGSWAPRDRARGDGPLPGEAPPSRSPGRADPFSAPPHYADPLNGRPRHEDPLNRPSRYEDPLSGPSRYQAPGDRTPRLDDPLTRPMRRGDPLAGPPRNEVAREALPRRDDPLSGPPGREDPLNGSQHREDPLNGSARHQAPHETAPRYDDSISGPTRRQDPLDGSARYEVPRDNLPRRDNPPGGPPRYEDRLNGPARRDDPPNGSARLEVPRDKPHDHDDPLDGPQRYEVTRDVPSRRQDSRDRPQPDGDPVDSLPRRDAAPTAPHRYEAPSDRPRAEDVRPDISRRDDVPPYRSPQDAPPDRSTREEVPREAPRDEMPREARRDDVSPEARRDDVSPEAPRDDVSRATAPREVISHDRPSRQEDPPYKASHDEVPLDPAPANGGPVPYESPVEIHRPNDRSARASDRDRPERGSVAEMSLRLERLPAGHPSSPYNDDGTRKPPVPSLKDLELPLPADDHGTPANISVAADRRTTAERNTTADQSSTAGGGQTGGHSEAPDQHRETRPASSDSHGNPKPQLGADGSWHWKGLDLTHEERRIADDTLSRCRITEGRSVFGNYGDTGLTPAMRRIEAQLEHGELVPDTEEFALKSPDRFKEKLAKSIQDEPDKSPQQLAAEIHDGVRYTFLFDQETYAQDVGVVGRKLQELGFRLIVRKNTWDNDEYKGVNTRWTETESDTLFEIQFHTHRSWDVKQSNHEAYEKINNLSTLADEKERLRASQREASADIPFPLGYQDITDYRREGW